MIDDAMGCKRVTMVLYHLMMNYRQGRQIYSNCCRMLMSVSTKCYLMPSTAEYGLLPEEKYHSVCLLILLGHRRPVSPSTVKISWFIPIVLLKAAIARTGYLCAARRHHCWSREYEKIPNQCRSSWDWLKPIFTISVYSMTMKKPLISRAPLKSRISGSY